VSASNRLPVSDSAIDSLIDAGALSIGGTVSLAGTPTVALGAGTNAIGSLTVSNFPVLWSKRHHGEAAYRDALCPNVGRYE
jgi:hypothetical protein